MKRIISVLTISLLVTFLGIPTALAMGRVRKADKPACSGPESPCKYAANK